MSPAILLFLTSGLAYANGANDVSKAVATIVGTGVATARRAAVWGALWAGAGAAAAVFVTGAMVTTIASGFLHGQELPSPDAALAPLVGASAWVWLATRWGLPVSTTHAIVGGLAGAGLADRGLDGVAWWSVGERIALPLVLSPLVALVLTRVVLWASTPSGGSASTAPTCLCLVREVRPQWQLAPGGGPLLALPQDTRWRVASGTTDECRRALPHALSVAARHLHWLSSGAVSFARGLNDAPKLVALAVWAGTVAPAQPVLSTRAVFACVAAAMLGGGLFSGGRVTHRLAWDVTPMDDREGLVANLVSAVLVALGAVHGLPMSTTHVSGGSIAGVGTSRGTVARKTMRDIGIAWLITVPVAALLAGAARCVMHIWHG